MRYLVVFIFIITLSQNQYAQSIAYDSSYNKWLHAIINIEVRASNFKMHESLDKEYRAKRISWQGYIQKSQSLSLNSPAWSGTAILLEDNGNHFLLTARHVLSDPTGSDSNSVGQKIILIENDTLLNDRNIKIDQFNNLVTNNNVILIMNLSSGAYETNPYILSSVNDDIGIICLDIELGCKEFYKTLIKRGYRPITTNDIDSLFSVKRGEEIYSIGFPENSFIRNKNLIPTLHIWESNLISIPVVTKGTYISEYPLKSNYFDAKMFVYHGFSGAPVIKNNKLIGIVSGGEGCERFYTGDKLPFGSFYQNHSKFIKSTLIKSTLKQLEWKIGYR